MDIEEFEQLFEEYDDEYLEFDKIENKFSNRPDLHAFLLLDKLLPSDHDIISASEHDQFWIGVDINELLEVITEEYVKELIRCGVSYDESVESLYMLS